ncbi:unnamed protein product [Cylicocyclus nassatus]|uniref:Transthyretin-like family protein n=1 Tax=Cylicocyclus nassatus TaxID=53992 RepID=A0AA36M4C9_CYLNA|nr:unnamed protein product [Cylicocyclus nassatus]
MNFGRLQSAGVKGLVYCKGKPAKGVSVKLYEKELMFDRLMDKGKTDKYGAFKLWGRAREWSDIEPVLYIYNKCGRRFARKVTIDIPSTYITHFGQKCKTMYRLYSLSTIAFPVTKRCSVADA